MELADESVDESPFRMDVGSSSCISSSSNFSGINIVTSNNNGNPFSLFYSPNSSIQHTNVIQSSRAPNSWIASLRSNNKEHSYSPIISALDGRHQRRYELKYRDDIGRINKRRTGAANHARSTSIDGGLSSSSHSLPSSSFRHWASLESIQRNQRLRQLAEQSTTKVRSLSTRESTAAAERWRYIQSVLERRRQESLEHRERFIRQPLDNIRRQKSLKGDDAEPRASVWGDSFIMGKSILKRQTHNWRMKARRHVHFDMNQENQTIQQASDNLVNRDKLPVIISIAEEITEARPSTSHETLVGEYEQDQRLPPLMMTPSPEWRIMEIINDDPQQREGRDDTPQSSELVSPTGPSWVERQVAKVRQRKLWAFRQQQQEKLNHHHHHHPPRAILKPSVSLLVNVPDESDTETDSLNEEEEEEDQQDDRSESHTRQSLAWDVMMDKDELAEMSNKEQIKEETSVDSSYCGWPHFPAKLAICIQQRQKSLRERKAGRKDSQETRNDGKLNHHNNNNNGNGNSFERRKRFGKKLSIAVVRQQRKRRIPNRVLSSIHQPQAIQSSSDPIQQHKNENENDPAVLQNADDDVGQCLTNAISSLQVLDSSSHPIRNADEFSETSSTAVESNEIHTTTPSPSVSPSDDQISEADMIQPMEDASVSRSESSDAETIVADAQYHLDELIPAAADDPMTSNKEIDDENDYPQNAGSTFCHPVSHVCQRHPDESISDVTVDDGPYYIDQSELTIPQQQNDGMTVSRLDTIPADAGISSVVEQTEYHISLPIQHRSPIDNQDNVLRTGHSAYCSGWPIGVISNQNGAAIPSHPPHSMSTNVSYLWDDNFEAPTSEETMMGTINHPEVDISSEATAFAIPGTQKDSNHPPPPPPLPVSPVIIQTSLDKKTKEARNASRILFPTVPMSIATEKERPPSGQTSKDQHHKMEQDKNVSDSMEEEEMVDDCQCLHRAVLTCLLPDAAETLDNLELIRRQLKKARIRRHQGSEQQQRQQPMQVRRDILLSTIDPNVSSSTN